MAWKGSPADTAAVAAELMPSGRIMWGLDEAEEIFDLYLIPYQPVVVLIGADKTVVGGWAGLQDEATIRASLDALVAG